jgi:hypothetical protein
VKHSLIAFGVAQGEGEMERLAVTSREMLQVERTQRGFATQQFLSNITMDGLYKVAYVALRSRGRIDQSVKFDDFVDGWSITMSDPELIARRKAIAEQLAAQGATASQIMAAVEADDLLGPPDEDDTGAEVDPTQTTA